MSSLFALAKKTEFQKGKIELGSKKRLEIVTDQVTTLEKIYNLG